MFSDTRNPNLALVFQNEITRSPKHTDTLQIRDGWSESHGSPLDWGKKSFTFGNKHQNWHIGRFLHACSYKSGTHVIQGHLQGHKGFFQNGRHGFAIYHNFSIGKVAQMNFVCLLYALSDKCRTQAIQGHLQGQN